MAIYNVTLNYGPRDWSTNEKDNDPSEFDSYSLSTSWETIKRVFDFDADGNRVCNSAGEDYTKPVEVDERIRVIRLTRKEWRNPHSKANEYTGTVNSSPIWGGDAGEWLMEILADENSQEIGWKVDYNMRYRKGGYYSTVQTIFYKDQEAGSISLSSANSGSVREIGASDKNHDYYYLLYRTTQGTVATSALYDNGIEIDRDSNYILLCDSPVNIGIQHPDGTFEIYSEGEVKLTISDIVVGSASCQCLSGIQIYVSGVPVRMYRNYQLVSYTSNDIARCNAYYTITQDGTIHYDNEIVGEIAYGTPDYTSLCEKYLWDRTTVENSRQTPYKLYYEGWLVYEDSTGTTDSWYTNCCNDYFVLSKNSTDVYAESLGYQARFFYQGELYLDDVVSHLTCCPGPNADRFISKNTSVLYVHDEEYGFMKFDPRSLSRIA